jgi:hypothetical protein
MIMEHRLSDEVARLTQIQSRMSEGLVPGSETAMRLLLAEMEALLSILPGAQPRSEVEQSASEAEVEAGYDNMPV